MTSPLTTGTRAGRLLRPPRPDVARGVVGRRDPANDLRQVAAADAVRDTPHDGGGANTVAAAAACGTPLATLTGRFQANRHEWDRAAGLSAEYRMWSTAVAAAGKRTDLAGGTDRLVFALDDTPNGRSGRRGRGTGCITTRHPNRPAGCEN